MLYQVSVSQEIDHISFEESFSQQVPYEKLVPDKQQLLPQQLIQNSEESKIEFFDLLNKMSQEAREMCFIILKSKKEIMEKISPFDNIAKDNLIKYFSQHRGWRQNVVKCVIEEIKAALSDNHKAFIKIRNTNERKRLRREKNHQNNHSNML